ncbi:DUF6161 domain-containing protein [Aliarcobacter butzleri]
MNINFKDITNTKEWSFDNIEALKKFIENEKEFWNQEKSKLNNDRNLSSYFNIVTTLTQILSKLSSIENIEDEQQKRQGLAELQSEYFRNLHSNFIWSGQPFVNNWLEAYKVSIDTGNAFIDAIIKNQTQNNQNFKSMQGYILAYEYQMQGKSELTKRQISEEKSFEALRDRLDKKTNELITHVDEFEKNIDDWQSKTIDYIEKAKRVNTKLLHRTQKKRNQEFNDYMASTKSKIEELENTYQEKLRLEKPAAYWNTKASEYKTQGNKWAKILAWTLGIGFLVFGTFFIMWIKSIEIGLTLNSMQGAVIFATVIAIYAYLVRVITKMVFSSFHLQRDAEEREQLTHVYLALSNENGAIDEDSRKIVLQALFSRADSGLLHKDSSPTMPGMITDFVKMTGGK